MSETKYLFERVKKTATKAIQAERKGDLKHAFDLFLKAAELLNQLITIERSQKIRDSYYTKAKQYIARAKEIKALIDGPTPKIADVAKDLPDLKSPSLPSPPKEQKKGPLPPPPPPKKEIPPPPTSTRQTPPPPPSASPEDLTKKIMRGEDEPLPPPPSSTEQKPVQPPPEKTTPQPKKEINIPTKTTFELLYDEGKYRECVLECAKSVEAELRVRLGLFDEHLTLGMLIERGIKKGLDSLVEFKYVNILINRIDHENYRPKQLEALKAVEITNKILLS